MDTGALIGGRFRVATPLGAGGMGVVYRAHDERLGRDVAVKVLAADAVGDATARARLVREARVVATLNHAGIIHVYDAGETDDGEAYLVMELVAGTTLRELVRAPEWSIRARLQALVEAARALAAAHRAGLVHRDVKPDNLMLRDDGRLVVLDFGIAKEGAHGSAVTEAASQVTADGVVVGTPAYLSPEQVRGEAIGARTDQFALAVTGYELLTGALPWKTNPPLAVIASLISDEPAPLALDDADLSARVDAVLRRALAKSPDERWPDLDAFADALVEIIGGAPVSLKPSSRISAPASASSTAALARTELIATTEPRARRRWKRQAALALGVVSIAAASVWTWQYRANPLARPDAVLACPVFEGVVDGAPAGWLGAAAASRFCALAAPALGGFDEDHVRYPAELLDLPRQQSETFPEDPFQDSNARERSVAAAIERHLPYADGRVVYDGKFHVTVTVRAPSGRALGVAEASHERFVDAILGSFEALALQGGIPKRATLDARFAAWRGTKDVDGCVLAAGIGTLAAAHGGKADCQRALARDLGRSRLGVEALCANSESRTSPGPAPASDDLPSIAQWLRAFETEALAEVATYPREAYSATLTAGLSNATGTVRAEILLALARASGEEQGGPSARNAALASPRLAWSDAEYPANGSDPEMAAASRVGSAWGPDSFRSWFERGRTARDLRARARWLERSFILEPGAAYSSLWIDTLLALKRTEAAIADVARVSVVDMKLGRFLEGKVQAADTRFDFALKGWTSLLVDASELFGVDRGYDNALLSEAREVANILGRERPFADAVTTWFLGTDPAWIRGEWGGGVGLTNVAALCAVATPALGRRCLERLRSALPRLERAPFYEDVLRVAEAYLSGDYTAAAQAGRPLLKYSWVRLRTGVFLGDVFDRGGLPELGDAIDLPRTVDAGELNGANLAYVRVARRAAARGDWARAKDLAQKVVDAWKLSDAPVPAVDEMRALLAKAP